MKKIITFFFTVLVLVAMGAFMVYKFFFSEEKNFRLLGDILQLFLIYFFLLSFALHTWIQGKKYTGVLVKGVFVNDKSSYKKWITAIKNFRKKKYTKTLEILRKLEYECVGSKDLSMVKLLEAMCYHAECKYDDAIDIYKIILAADEKNAYAWAYLGYIYDERKQKELATQAYAKALQYQPDDAFVRCCKAYHHMEGMELKQAYESATEAMKLDKKRDDAAAIAALCCAFDGNEIQAKKYCADYYPENKQQKELKTWIFQICENKSKPSPTYCSDVRQFQHVFRL